VTIKAPQWIGRPFTDEELCRLSQGPGLPGTIYLTAAHTGLSL